MDQAAIHAQIMKNLSKNEEEMRQIAVKVINAVIENLLAASSRGERDSCTHLYGWLSPVRKLSLSNGKDISSWIKILKEVSKPYSLFYFSFDSVLGSKLSDSSRHDIQIVIRVKE